MLTEKQKKEFAEEENISSKLRDIFGNYDPCSRKEISYEELSEILLEVSKIFKGDELALIKKRETIQFLAILEELGILSEDQRRYLYCAKVKIERYGKIETWEFPIYFFTNNAEIIYELLSDSKFIEEECTAFCSSFLYEPFSIDVCDPSEMFNYQPLESKSIY